MVSPLEQFLPKMLLWQRLQNREYLQSQLQHDALLQELMGYDMTTMARFYGAARHLIEEKRYKDALKAFLFLSILNPHNQDYWLGLGMALQLEHQYEPAIDAYELAAHCGLESPVPYFYLAKCLFSIHDRDSALYALDMAIEYAVADPEYSDLKHQAEAARKILLLGDD